MLPRCISSHLLMRYLIEERSGEAFVGVDPHTQCLLWVSLAGGVQLQGRDPGTVPPVPSQTWNGRRTGSQGKFNSTFLLAQGTSGWPPLLLQKQPLPPPSTPVCRGHLPASSKVKDKGGVQPQPALLTTLLTTHPPSWSRCDFIAWVVR